jgi:peroxiredoxin
VHVYSMMALTMSQSHPLSLITPPDVIPPTYSSLLQNSTLDIGAHNQQYQRKNTMLRLFYLSSLLLCGLASAFSPSNPSLAATISLYQRTSSALKMASVDEVKVGDKIPSVVLKEGQADYEKPVDVNIGELIAGKKVALFAVPGAFTPGCSKSHLPSFITVCYLIDRSKFLFVFECA